MFVRAFALLALALVQLAPASLFSAEKYLSQLEMKTERVIIFKDGYSLIIKRGVATSNQDGEVYTDEVPDAAVLGSFWAVPEQGRLISMTAGWKTTKDASPKDLPCRETLEVLLANKGKQAKIELHDKTILTGIIREVLVDKTEAVLSPEQLEMLDRAREATAQPTPAGIPGAVFASGILSSRVSPIRPVAVPEVYTLSAISGSNFILRTDDGDALLQVGQIRSVTVKDMRTTLSKTLTTTKRTKRLTFKVEGGEKKHAISIMYFRPGIRWVPTYRISLGDKLAENKQKKATISLQAELLNEAEDLENVSVDIVVGVPNFRFRGTPSPLVLEATLRNALAEAAPDLMGNGSQQLSNAIYSQRSSEFRRAQAGANEVAQGTINLPGELTATGAQDLFVYNLSKLSLGMGERIAVPIFTADTTYRDIYTWDVHVTKNDNAAAPSGAGTASPLTLSKNEVWHQILLTNNTNVPWTTGAAMIMQGNQPLAQELLTYTPPKDEVRVPVTVAVDTRGSLTERETGRDLKALHWDGYNYARIDREMQLDLCNNKAIDIEAEISVRVGGKVTKASHDGNVTLGDFNPADWIQYRGQPAVNNSSTTSWKVKLKPGDKFEPILNYHHFTRH